MSWSSVLQDYAKKASPEKELPDGVFLQADSHTLTIFDGYEKAKYHFLIMPRDPFLLSSGQQIPSRQLDSLSALLKSAHAKEVLVALKSSGESVKAMIEDEMLKDEGFTWPIQIGFHAAESMKHVHLHVISSDLISEKLKNKKHYNSFHPKLGFFLHLDEVIDQVEHNDITVTKKTSAEYENLLKQPLESFYTGEEFKTIPKLKDHLEEHWVKRGKKAKKAREKDKESESAKRKMECETPAEESETKKAKT